MKSKKILDGLSNIVTDWVKDDMANKPCYTCESSPCVCEEIDPIEIETDLSTGKKYMDGLKLSQVDEFLINKINLIILFINSIEK